MFPDKKSELRRDLLLLTAIAATLCALFADIVFFGNGFFFRDIASYAYPMKSVVREALRSGEFPYWNPFYSGGEPLAANPAYQIFYPPQWLVLLPDLHFAVQSQILLHFFIGIAGMFFLLRVYGVTRSVAAFGCVAFGLSGFFLGLVNLLWILFALAWTPWIFAFLHLLVTRRSRACFAGAAITIGMQILVGEPMMLLQTAVAIAGYLIYRAWRQRFERRVLRETVLIVFAGLAGVLLSAAQLFPAIDFFRDTTRAQGFTFETSSSWSMPPARPLEFVYPSVFGSADLSDGLFWGYRRYPGRARPLLLSIYPGFLIMLFALSGLVRRQRGWILVLIVFGVCYLVAVGSHTPVFRWLHETGVFATLRYPERSFAPVLIVVVIFATVVYHRMREGDVKLVKTAILIAIIAGAVALFAAISTYRADYVSRFRRSWDIPDTPAELARSEAMARVNRSEWWLAAARAGLAAALLAWGMRDRTRRWEAGVWIYLLADLGPFSNSVLNRMPEQFFTAPAIASQLPGDRDRYRIFHVAAQAVAHPEAVRYASLDDGTYWMLRNGLFPYTAARWGFRTIHEPSIDATTLIWSAQLTASLPVMAERRPYDWADRISALSNARFHAHYRPFDEAVSSAQGVVENLVPVRFVETPFHPRYYLADRVVSIRDHKDFLDQFTSPEFTYRSAFVSGPAFKPPQGRILSVRETWNSVEMSAESPGSAYLVASNSFHRYWRATANGVELPIERTNVAFQGIRVSAGNHRVVFRYRNPLQMPSLIVSILALAGLIVACLVRRSSISE